MSNTIRKTITLTLTQSCNLSCIYCYENHKSSRKMSWETAKKCIDYELLLDDGYEEVEFDLFGGEPFLNFPLIRKIVEYVTTYNTQKKVLIFIVTNGTLLTDKIKKWLIDNKKYVICGLSLDGTKEMNDINRCNSFDDIDIDFFLKHYPEQSVKMTVSPQTLPLLSNGVIFLHEKGFIPSCNLAYNIDWSKEDNVVILERELNNLINYYLANPNVKPTSLLDMSIVNVAFEENYMIPFCGAGRGMKAYDIDGECYPCQFFMPLSVGAEKAKLAQKMTYYQDYIPEELWDNKCKNCVIKNVCPTCLGANYASSGNMFYHEDNYCMLTKITMKARSYFKGMQIKLGQLSEEEKTQINALKKAIVMIQKELKI